MTRPAHGLRVQDVFPRARLLGRCHDCRRVVFDMHPHDWADPTTNALRWPLAPGAALFCGRCSDVRG